MIFDPDAYVSESDPRVTIEVWPATGRLPPARHEVLRQRDHAYRARIPFDREEPWSVKLVVRGSRGADSTGFQVRVTPPGYGRWDLVIYLGPFLLVGAMWVFVALRRRRLATETGTT